MANLQAKQKWFINNEIEFIKFYKSLPNKPNTTYRVFDHKEFYSTHEDNAIFTAKQVFKTSFMKEIGGDKKLLTIYLSQKNFESFARNLLLVLQYRLEVYKQDNNNEWKISCQASPGNLLEVEELLFSNAEISLSSSIVSAVKYHMEGDQCMVSLGVIDSSTSEIFYSTFADNEHFSNLESCLLQLGPKECLVSKLDTSPAGAKLYEIVKRSHVMITQRPKSEFHTKTIEQDLNRLLQKKQKESVLKFIGSSENTGALSCVAALLSYLQLMNKNDHFEHFTIKKYNLCNFMRLDSAAYSALNIFPEQHHPSVSINKKLSNSLFSLLNTCQTAQGQRILSRWLKQPLMDVNQLNERLTVVEAFVNCPQLRQTLADQHLRKMPDLDKLSKKFQRKVSSLQDCYKVYQALKLLQVTCSAFDKYCEEVGENYVVLKELFTSPLSNLLADFSKYTEMLETTLDFALVEKQEYMVRSDFDPRLEELHEQMSSLDKEMKSTFHNVSKQLNLERGKSIKMECAPQFGYVFRVTCRDEKAIRKSKDICVLDTNKAGVRFSNSAMINLSKSLCDCKALYQEQQASVVAEIMEIASGYADPLHCLSDIIGTLDVLLSFAQAAVSSPISYVRPQLHPCGSGENQIRLVRSRHPCVEQQDGVSFIPNDATLQNGNSNFMIVTGPNMGGKSTFIRQIGVIVLMAQIGSFVPCDEAEITVVDAILARVGAGDCQSKGVSTFMAEMLETASILQAATCNSLVIIDELGRGTSTYDGFGLAWSISRHIAFEIKATCLFATHFHEMTSLAEPDNTVVNYHMTALTDDVESPGNGITMLYQVKPGVCDRSFGIHVAEFVGFPADVVTAAKRKADNLEDFYFTIPTDPTKCENIEMELSNHKKMKLEGEALINEFLEEVRLVPWKSLPSSSHTEKLEVIKSKLHSSNNSYVNAILKKVQENVVPI